MNVSSTGSMPSFASDALKDMWAGRVQQGQGDKSVGVPSPTEGTTASPTIGIRPKSSLVSANGSIGEVMNSYMMGQPTGEDKYIRAKKMAAQAQNTMNTAQLGILAAGIVAGQMGGSMADKVLAGKKAAAAMEQQKGEATMDESQKNLDEIAEDVQERSDDAVNTEEKEVTENSTATSAEEGADVETSETTAPTSEAEKADTASTPEQNADSAKDVLVPENTVAPPAPPQPSVDIMV